MAVGHGQAFIVSCPSASVVQTGSSTPSVLRSSTVISFQEDDFEFDLGQGGVRLAEKSVIKITGVVQHKPGSATPNLKDLVRYTQMKTVGQSELISSDSFKVITTGLGKAMYKDPGESITKEVIYAPRDAVRDSLNAAGSAMEYPRIVINFCGGDDLQVLEVLEAVREMVLDLDIATSAKVSFNSMSHSTFPAKQATVTVVGLKDESTVGGLKGDAKALANGEVYFADGKYWTLSEDDINTAVA